ncbi:MAG: ion transporter [Saprospiraceae bacterium]|nr:MAG: Ion transport protein [Bacteroidetes bacterium OLB9]MCO6464573.1 ion transporter [Saprospiraceae bacterium]
MISQAKNKSRDERNASREDFKKRIYTILFETSTPQGRKFDIYLLGLICFALLILMIESLPTLSPTAKLIFYIIEWIISITFAIEYILRIYVSPKPIRYILSIWGIIDLLSVLPILFLAFSDSTQYFRIIRVLRLIRIFKIFRINKFTREAYSLYYSLTASVYKISVFMFFVVLIAIIMGGFMFIVEHENKTGFNSIPDSIYWAIVTVTTVGFGDITPKSDLGKLLASIMMLLGYAIIAVPTGIISMEMFKYQERDKKPGKKCLSCNHENDFDAQYCNQCGERMKLTGIEE